MSYFVYLLPTALPRRLLWIRRLICRYVFWYLSSFYHSKVFHVVDTFNFCLSQFQVFSSVSDKSGKGVSEENIFLAYITAYIFQPFQRFCYYRLVGRIRAVAKKANLSLNNNFALYKSTNWSRWYLKYFPSVDKALTNSFIRPNLMSNGGCKTLFETYSLNILCTDLKGFSDLPFFFNKMFSSLVIRFTK